MTEKDKKGQGGGVAEEGGEEADDGYTPPQEDYLPPGLQVSTLGPLLHMLTLLS